MRFTGVFGLATTFASLSSAHTLFSNFFIDDVNQGDGTCVRMPKDSNTCTNPIAGIDSDDMVCGRDGLTAVAFTCPAPAGAKLTFEFRLVPDLSSPGSIDVSHQGPAAVYLKQVNNMATDSAAGDGWFKIWEEGYDESAKQWGTEKIMANNGLLSVNLPSGIPTGYYLVRPELLSLQNVPDAADPQFYVGCAQLFVQGSVTGSLEIPAANMVSIPGHVQPTDKSVTFDIYANPMALPYPVPGPEPYYPTAADNSGSVSTLALSVQSAAEAQTDGAIPDACLIKNANWCGVEVPSYTTESGCWAASEDCYQQEDACYKSAPPTGDKGCAAWGDKCQTIQNACSAGNFNGPPNAGEKLEDVDAAVPGAIPAAESTSGTATAVVAAGSSDPSPTVTSETTPTTVAAASTATATSTATDDGDDEGEGEGDDTPTGDDEDGDQEDYDGDNQEDGEGDDEEDNQDDGEGETSSQSEDKKCKDKGKYKRRKHKGSFHSRRLAIMGL